MKVIRLLGIGFLAVALSAAHAQAQTSPRGRSAGFSFGGVSAIPTLNSVEDPFSSAAWSPEKSRVNLGGLTGSIGWGLHLWESSGLIRSFRDHDSESRSRGPIRRASFSLGAVYTASGLGCSYTTPEAYGLGRLSEALPGRTMRGLSFGAGFFLSPRLEIFLSAHDTRTGRYWGEVSVFSGDPKVPSGYSAATSGQNRSASRFQLLLGLRVHPAARGRLDPYLGLGVCATSASLALASSVPYNVAWTGSYDDAGNPIEMPEFTITGVEVENVKAHAMGGFVTGGLEFGLNSRLRVFAEGLYTVVESKSAEHPLSRSVSTGPYNKVGLSLGGFATSIGLRFAAPDRFSPNPYGDGRKRGGLSIGLLYVRPALGYSTRYSQQVYYDTGTLADSVPAKASVPGINFGLGYLVSRKVELFAGAYITMSGSYRGKVSLTLPGYYRDTATDVSQQDRRASQFDLLFGAKCHIAPLSGIDPYFGFGGCYASASLQFTRLVTIEDEYGPFGDYYLTITRVDLEDVKAHALGGFVMGGCEVAVGRGVAVFAEGFYKIASKTVTHPGLLTSSSVNLGGFIGSLGLRIGL